MVKINCEAPLKLKLRDMLPIQGDLKKRNEADFNALEASLLNLGLMVPFFVWMSGGMYYIVDGHGRFEALTRLAAKDVEIYELEFPAIKLDAPNIDKAKELLLLVNSRYGKITKKGAEEFLKSFQSAAVDLKYIRLPVKLPEARPMLNMNTMMAPVPPKDRVIKLKVDIAKVDELLSLLKQVPFVKVL